MPGQLPVPKAIRCCRPCGSNTSRTWRPTTSIATARPRECSNSSTSTKLTPNLRMTDPHAHASSSHTEVELADEIILIRQHRDGDAELLYNAVRESIAEVSPWLPW